MSVLITQDGAISVDNVCTNNYSTAGSRDNMILVLSISKYNLFLRWRVP